MQVMGGRGMRAHIRPLASLALAGAALGFGAAAAAADTLEWATDSPTPEYSFVEVPIVEGRHPLWEGPLEYGTGPFGAVGALERAIPTTGGLSAEPEHVLYVPPETALPFWVAVGVALIFLAFLVEAALVAAIGVVLAFLAGLRWVWRVGGEHPDIVEVEDRP